MCHVLSIYHILKGQLSVEIHKGTRPKLNCINGDIPPEIISMMKKCWHVDRSVRLTAIECLSLLQKAGPRSKFDIYFSYCPSFFCCNYFDFLVSQRHPKPAILCY